MKYTSLIFLLLSILSTGCANKSEDSITTNFKKRATNREEAASQYLTRGDIEVLQRVSNKTLDRIQKGQLLEFSDIISMQRSGIQTDTMIQVLLFTHSKFNLTTTEIIQLQTEGVPFKVINFMIRI
jgi:hypothetical protein